MTFWTGFLLTLLAAASLNAPQQLTNATDDAASKNRGASEPNTTSAAARKRDVETVTRNRMSSVELKWRFGGREQRGWTIYFPLISKAVGASAGPDSEDFAKAVGRWQESRAIHQTKVVDNETWSKMIEEFQSRRIKKRDYPSAQDLVVAPASEFYDPDRPVELRQVESATYAAYKRMVADAEKELSPHLSANESQCVGRYLKIISAFRTREHQEQLRKSAPHSGRAGLAVNSPHFTGRALDLYVGGEPVSTSESNRLLQTSTPVYKWLVENAARYGFRPYFYEPWHWEYLP